MSGSPVWTFLIIGMTGDVYAGCGDTNVLPTHVRSEERWKERRKANAVSIGLSRT